MCLMVFRSLPLMCSDGSNKAKGSTKLDPAAVSGCLHRHQQSLADCLPAQSWRYQREGWLRDQGPAAASADVMLMIRW